VGLEAWREAKVEVQVEWGMGRNAGGWTSETKLLEARYGAGIPGL